MLLIYSLYMPTLIFSHGMGNMIILGQYHNNDNVMIMIMVMVMIIIRNKLFIV